MVKAVAATYEKRVGEIAYIFCSDEKILEVNRRYLQHDYYTDIITFDYCEGNRLSGDLFISLDTVRTNAEQFAGNDYERELYRVIIHGHPAPMQASMIKVRRAGDYGSSRKQSSLAMQIKDKKQNITYYYQQIKSNTNNIISNTFQVKSVRNTNQYISINK